LGLREQKKKHTESRILSSLESLLGHKPVGSIAMTEIARLARVSVGTLYNYYESKDDLVFRYARMKLRPFVARAQEVAGAPRRSGRLALESFLQTYADGFVSMDRSVISHVMRVSFEQNIFEGTETHFQTMASAQLKELIEKLQSRGLVARSVDREAVALVLFSIFMDLLSQYSRDCVLGPKELRSRLHNCVELVFDGLRKRPSGGSPKAGGRWPAGHPQEVTP